MQIDSFKNPTDLQYPQKMTPLEQISQVVDEFLDRMTITISNYAIYQAGCCQVIPDILETWKSMGLEDGTVSFRFREEPLLRGDLLVLGSYIDQSL